jgi:pimeloyl-ACP methyl ester carboxylesterase
MNVSKLKTVTGTIAAPFSEISLYQIDRIAKTSSEGFIQEKYVDPSGTNLGTIQYLKPAVEIFGTTKPHSSLFLFHKMAGANTKKTPVLLVHGAGANAWIWCYDPIESITRNTVLFKLAEEGYPTYAISSAATQGSNHFQAEHIAAAIEIIKELHNVDKVDLIATGDGNIPVQIYLASAGRHKWMTPYRNDVRKYLGLGSPNLGIDYQFRYPFSCLVSDMLNYYDFYPFTANSSPLIFSYNPYFMSRNMFGIVLGGSIPENTDTSAFATILEMAYPLDKEPSMNLTVATAGIPYIAPDYSYYYGGWTAYGYSLGINEAVKMGGHTIERIIKNQIPDKIDSFLCIGLDSFFKMAMLPKKESLSQNIVMEKYESFLDEHVYNNVTNEWISNGSTEPFVVSDSIVSLYSMEKTEGFKKKPEKTYFNCNHLDYQSNNDVISWVLNNLG